MARLSGIPDDPEKAPICLGCHATAADTEKWERDPGFRHRGRRAVREVPRARQRVHGRGR